MFQETIDSSHLLMELGMLMGLDFDAFLLSVIMFIVPFVVGCIPDLMGLFYYSLV
jgi:hypothetical protein